MLVSPGFRSLSLSLSLSLSRSPSLARVHTYTRSPSLSPARALSGEGARVFEGLALPARKAANVVERHPRIRLHLHPAALDDVVQLEPGGGAGKLCLLPISSPIALCDCLGQREADRDPGAQSAQHLSARRQHSPAPVTGARTARSPPRTATLAPRPP